MRKYAHIFFDLDHTLWDFRTNSRATLAELHADERLADQGVPDAQAFIEVYEEVNQVLWARYEAGRLHKDVLRVLRFRNTLLHFGVRTNGLAERIGEAYLERCPTKPQLMPGARALLDALHGHYRLHIITNGFDSVQRVKLESSDLGRYFDVVLSSERAGARKPDPRIFGKALKLAGAEAASSLMVGDNHEADMFGARQAGWDHVHYAAETTPDAESTYRITHFDELGALLLGRK
ncbi:MAG: YjjG family noncanonical pyrimidine nucleotidase [Flavobacteriales bacterium]|nr:YjjG family noncanonical pyrimidine nucleotidase [Flavobacteriales bacterium]